MVVNEETSLLPQEYCKNRVVQNMLMSHNSPLYSIPVLQMAMPTHLIVVRVCQYKYFLVHSYIKFLVPFAQVGYVKQQELKKMVKKGYTVPSDPQWNTQWQLVDYMYLLLKYGYFNTCFHS